MPERAQVFEGSQIGLEVTPGTTVTATKRLIGTTIAPKIESQSKPVMPKGSRMNTGAIPNKQWTSAQISQDPAMYTDISYVLAGLFGSPTITNPSSGVYLHEWDPLNFTGLTPKTYTVETGGFVRARKFGYGLVTGVTMQGSREGVTLSADMIGQKQTTGVTLSPGTAEVQTLHKTGTVSGGTFTITFQGETTATIAYNANNAAVLAALVALPNLDTGDVVLGGGPVGTSDLTITFGGQYASADVPLMVVNSASLTGGGTYDITQTTAGVPLTATTMAPISGNHWDFYLDSAYGSLGTTKLTRCFNWSWGITGMYGPIWPGNTSNASYAAHTDLKPSTTFTFQVEGDSTGEGFLTYVDAGTVVYPRIKMTGPTLGASTYLAQFDFAVAITGVTDNEDVDGVYGMTLQGEIDYSASWGKYISVDVKNDISAL
jgi:hypothetical protein